MRTTLSLQAASSQPSGRLLLHLATELDQLQIDLEKLIGTEPLGSGMRFWIIIVKGGGDRVKELAAILAVIPGISNVRIEANVVGSAAPFEVFERPALTDWSI